MRIALFAIASLALGCATEPRRTDVDGWTKQKVVGLSMDLIDPDRVEQYRFARGGYVSTTVGTRELLSGPLAEWRVRAGILQILDSGKVTDELTLLHIDGRVMTVRRRSGETDRFRYTYEKA